VGARSVKTFPDFTRVGPTGDHDLVVEPRTSDVVIIGSGFGGSVAALRLTEKGHRVTVLEAGRRFDDDTLPRSSWDVRSFLWAPAVRCLGIQRITLLRNVLVLSGAGVGGGSLVYANTLYEPPDPFYADQTPRPHRPTKCCATSRSSSASATRSDRRRWASTSANRVSRCPTRTSVAWVPHGAAAPNAVRA